MNNLPHPRRWQSTPLDFDWTNRTPVIILPPDINIKWSLSTWK